MCKARFLFFFLHDYILLSRKQALVLASRGERQMKWTHVPVGAWPASRHVKSQEVGRSLIHTPFENTF